MALPKLNTHFMEGIMAENKKKFVMPLVWHSCKIYPPSEDYNPALIITNGEEIFDMRWDKEEGFYVNCSGGYMYLNPISYERWWWADIEQTVRGCSEFKEAK